MYFWDIFCVCIFDAAYVFLPRMYFLSVCIFFAYVILDWRIPGLPIRVYSATLNTLHCFFSWNCHQFYRKKWFECIRRWIHSGDSSVFGEIRVYSAKDRVYSASIRVYSAEHFLKFETHSSVFGGIRVYSAGECIRRNGRVYSARTQPFTAPGLQ